jgi:uncharacterized protein
MRISAQNQQVIRQTAIEVFGPSVRVRVFGSRINDNSKGGDIDLLVESALPINDSNRKSLVLVAKLQMQLGDQPIDVLVIDPDTIRQPIHEMAMQTGITL